MENLDNRINWVGFYSGYLNNPKPCGSNKMHACCPFHEEKHPSFWFNTKNGLFKCEGCGESGNATVFLSKIKGITQSEAYSELLELAGGNIQPADLEYNIDMYASEKCLNSEWLKSEIGISEGKDKAGKHIKIPYKDKSGNNVAVRKRYNPSKKPYFKWGQGSKLCLYGLWRLHEKEKYLIFVEGESDTQSMWMMDFTTCGVPGASNFKAEWVADIVNIPKIYLHIEPDQGGQTFLQQMAKKLYAGKYHGKVYTFNLNDYGVKDPSELYIKYGTDAVDMIKKAIAKSKQIDIQAMSEEIPESVKGMPVKLRVPEGWHLSEDGIFKFNKQTESYQRVSRTPIIITNRIHNMDTDEEKIQIAFKKYGRWRKGIYPATTIYQSRSIVTLAEIGAMVTSENAKQVVAFLEALESDNIDLIKEVHSVSQLGWADDEHFLPCNNGDIVLDVERNMESRLAAYDEQGDFEEWKRVMQPHRERNKFRFILSAAFAPVLLKLLNQRIFFIYNWGGSEGGKTAALHAALSVWGDPDSLKVSFNATRVGLEYTAAFYKDLPLGLNERQLAGDKQDSVEQTVYMLSEGASKVRGTKGGGLQKIKQWRTIVIATGEVELAGSSSQTGVSTRVLEIYGGPFDNKIEASNMYPFTAQCHGHAGPVFVQNLINNLEKKIVPDIHSNLQEYFRSKVADTRSISHIDAVSTVATADVLVSMWIYGEEQCAAITKAKKMGIEILMAQPTDRERDVNENALQYIIDWILSNKEQFTEYAKGAKYGFEKMGKYYIIPSVLSEALKRVGYTKTKTLRFLYEKGIISKDGDNGSYTVREYMDTKRSRFIEFDFEKAMNINQNLDDEFVPIDTDDDLPF